MKKIFNRLGKAARIIVVSGLTGLFTFFASDDAGAQKSISLNDKQEKRPYTFGMSAGYSNKIAAVNYGRPDAQNIKFATGLFGVFVDYKRFHLFAGGEYGNGYDASNDNAIDFRKIKLSLETELGGKRLGKRFAARLRSSISTFVQYVDIVAMDRNGVSQTYESGTGQFVTIDVAGDLYFLPKDANIDLFVGGKIGAFSNFNASATQAGGAYGWPYKLTVGANVKKTRLGLSVGNEGNYNENNFRGGTTIGQYMIGLKHSF